MVTINVLIYTDYNPITLHPEHDWSLSIVKGILETRQSMFVEFRVKLIHRYEDPANPQTITPDLLKDYDEIWIFGFYRRAGEPIEGAHGALVTELSPQEADALKAWMQIGGVLISGDHSQTDGGGGKLLSLGKALGENVPRAGQMRVWVGRPTNLPTSSFNTTVSTGTIDVFDFTAEADEVPQKLLLLKIFGLSGSNHPLFHGKDRDGVGRAIDLFPDHRHEGRVIEPRKLGKNWPPFDKDDDRKKRRPEIIALGCDKRHCEGTPVLAVYDGDGLDVGRIVADSSWHHYLNLNLRRLQAAAAASAFDLMAQFYPNLALYLAPASKRKEVSRLMFRWIVNHPEVLEEKGNPDLLIGGVAQFQLSRVASPYEISEMLHSLMPDGSKAGGEFFDFPPLAAGVRELPPRELVLGAIIRRFHTVEGGRLREGLSGGEAKEVVEELVPAGLKQAFLDHKKRALRITSASNKYLNLMGGY